MSAEGLRLWFAAPAPRWLTTLPVGNGRLGATVFGRVYKETIIFKPSDQLIEDTNPARARRRKPARPTNLTPAADDILFKG